MKPGRDLCGQAAPWACQSDAVETSVNSGCKETSSRASSVNGGATTGSAHSPSPKNWTAPHQDHGWERTSVLSQDVLLTHLKYFKIPAIGKNFISSGKTGLRYPEMFLLLQSLRASGAGAGAAGNAEGGAACPQAGGSWQEQSEGVQHSTAHLLRPGFLTHTERAADQSRTGRNQPRRPDQTEMRGYSFLLTDQLVVSLS